jgi:Fe2+ transport system protein FeoA
LAAPLAVKLSELALGASAVVRALAPYQAATTRLREMGLLPGTRITLVRTAPLGDPLEIKLRGYHLTLRRTEAEHVLVDPAS